MKPIEVEEIIYNSIVNGKIKEVEYYIKGTNIQHREDGPAKISLTRNHIEYLVHDQLHRVDGPAYMFYNDIKYIMICPEHSSSTLFTENDFYIKIAK